MFRLLLIFLAFLPAQCKQSNTVKDLSEGWSFSLNGSEAVLVDLPHDWAFENGYAPDGAQGEQGGFTCGGDGYYSKTITLSRKDVKGKTLYLDFDGAYMNSTVTVNGQVAGFREYGYISFSYDVTSLLKAGENRIEVRLDNTKEPSARWYHGCGLYGGVRLRTENPLHFVEDGLFVRTQNCNGNVNVDFETSADYSRVEATISRNGQKIAEQSSTEEHFCMEVSNPELWSPETPELYDFSIRLYDMKGRCTDVKNIKIGFKTIEWNPEKGLFLNGRQYKIHGVCEHLEGGPVGAAWTPELLRWKLQLLKDMGCNSVRTAHNPQLPFFYDICDEMGLLVMDEAFDGWKKKAPQDYGKQAFAECWEKDLTSMVRRDRNHACVYIWSVGNETKGDVAAQLIETCHKLDSSRMVTAGSAASDQMDVYGINGPSERQYFINDYKIREQAYIGTETPHTWQVRGFYRTMTWYRDGFPNKGQDPFVIPSLTESEIFGYEWTSPDKRANAKQVFNSSYDNATVRITVRQNMEVERTHDWYSGSYRWTGFDYIGEAGFVHGGWPFRAFMGGVIDMAGFTKDHYYLYQSEWNKSVDMVHILPFWTHPDMETGTKIPVWAYTTGDEVELFQDGISLGHVRKGTEWNKIQCSWMVPWRPGTIEAVAYREGREIARESISTAGEPSSFEVVNEKHGDYTFVTFRSIDSKGTTCPYADSRIYINLPEGNKVVSFENGSPVDDEKNVGATSRRLFFGLARAFIKGDASRITSGMICCDRSLKTSQKAYIAVNGLDSYEIVYSTDGSEPSVHYDGAFEVTGGMDIRAKVITGGKVVLSMEEKMEGGLYWGKPGEPPFVGRKMEFADDGTISWYQENDGSERDAAIKITYTSKEDVTVEISNKGKHPVEVTLPATLSAPQSVSVMTTLFQGANDLKLKLISGSRPEIQRIDVL